MSPLAGLRQDPLDTASVPRLVRVHSPESGAVQRVNSLFRSLFRFIALGFIVTVLTQSTAALAAPPAQPNFVLFLIDDLGWTDLSCYGSQLYETPNIDRLAGQGMRFTDAYSACTVCSPTRACVLTGRYPARLHVTDWIHGHRRRNAKLKIPDWTHYLAHEEVTIAEALGAAGYKTISIGKWHLGDATHGPLAQGFDINKGGYHRGQPPSYFSPYKIPTLKDGPAGEYLTDREAEEAVTFIKANHERPFFIYLPHYAVHTPIQGKRELTDKYRALVKPGMAQHNPAYAAMIESVDHSVGRVMRALEETGIARRTVVIFTSDNGGLVLRQITSNLPLRAGKGSSYEGGVRVPCIVKWPGVTQAGGICHEPVISADFFPTLAEVAGVKLDAEREIDGESLVPLLTGRSDLKREAIYWHYPHYHPGGATPYGAVRRGDWKLIEFFEDDHVELYNLRDDISERNDLAAAMPKLADRLRRNLHSWRTRVGAQMPRPNPDYAPAGK